MSEVKKVLFRAPVLTMSGYGTHSRQVAEHLLNRHDKGDIELFIQPLRWGHTPWALDSNQEDGLIGRIMQRTGQHKGLFDASIQLQLPNEWDPTIGKKNIGITAGVETDRCNPAWINAINKMDAVVVPTEFAKQGFLNTGGLTKEIHVIPESYNPCIPSCKEPLDIELDTSFNFLVFGQLTGNNKDSDRKNIFYTIRWLCEAFSDDPEVGIVLKTNMGRSTKIDRRVVLTTFKKIIGEIRKGPYPKIHIVHGNLSREEVAGLYKHPTIKGFVLLSRGEGFCLPMLDAAVSGVPVVATDHSGYLDFMNRGKFIKINHTLVNVHKSRVDSNIFMQGAKWAEASEEDFKKKIIKFRKSNRIPQEWAKELKGIVTEKYSLSEISKQYDKILSGLNIC